MTDKISDTPIYDELSERFAIERAKNIVDIPAEPDTATSAMGTAALAEVTQPKDKRLISLSGWSGPAQHLIKRVNDAILDGEPTVDGENLSAYLNHRTSYVPSYEIPKLKDLAKELE